RLAGPFTTDHDPLLGQLRIELDFGDEATPARFADMRPDHFGLSRLEQLDDALEITADFEIAALIDRTAYGADQNDGMTDLPGLVEQADPAAQVMNLEPCDQ